MTAVLNYPDTYPYKHCPHCGNDEFCIKERMWGVGLLNFRFDGEEADNTGMHDGLMYKPTGKYCYCNRCGKRLFQVEDGEGK